MQWSIKVARVAGTEIRIHFTFLLFLAWIGIGYYQEGGAAAAIQGILFIVLLFGCVLLHEFGHVLAARVYGIRTPDITLLPIGGVARLQRMPDQPWQELIVALAGPAVNVMIAGLLLLVTGFKFHFSDLEQMHHPQAALAAKVAGFNVVMVLFNLIPAFPMDGGRVLRAGLALVMDHGRATRLAARVGQVLAFGFGIFGLFGSPSPNWLLIVIALFVYMGAAQEAAMAQMKDMTTGLPVAEAMVTQFVTLAEGARLEEAVEALLRTSQHEFPVVDSGGRLLGILTRNDMFAALQRSGMTTPVVEVMRRNLPAVHPFDPFEQAFRLMQESNYPALPVEDAQGRLVGLITPENVGELMFVRSVLQRGAVPPWRRGASVAGRSAP
jgi:Zn-dependent protease/CBS domain-containing protein